MHVWCDWVLGAQMMQGTENEADAEQRMRDVAERTVKTLAPFLIKDAEPNGWLVASLPSADADTWRRTEKHLDQLRIACSELVTCFKQEVYILNVMLAEVVRVKNAATERRDDVLFTPLMQRFFGKVIARALSPSPRPLTDAFVLLTLLKEDGASPPSRSLALLACMANGGDVLPRAC